jgi:hypothetical protein
MKIRMALDDRDGFTERKARPPIICSASWDAPDLHRIPDAAKQGSNLINAGSFFEAASLDAVLSELAKTIMQAAGQARHAEERDLDDYPMSIDYLTAQVDWSEHFFGHKMDRSNDAGPLITERSRDDAQVRRTTPFRDRAGRSSTSSPIRFRS